MDPLISRLIKKKYKIGIFPIDDDEWQDLGSWDKFLTYDKKII